jgi:hypothetical protein
MYLLILQIHVDRKRVEEEKVGSCYNTNTGVEQDKARIDSKNAPSGEIP